MSEDHVSLLCTWTEHDAMALLGWLRSFKDDRPLAAASLDRALTYTLGARTASGDADALARVYKLADDAT